MSINRYNYEEFFLSYIDNELSIHERKEVEEFARQNPDLGEELQMMMQSILVPDKDIVFRGKESLLQTTESEHHIHESNCQEFFVRYGDDELSTSEKAAVEQFVYHHPQFQGEFELILEVKFAPDHTVVFPDKKRLYRYEKNARPVIFTWWKISAAAMVLLIAGFSWFNVQYGVKRSVNGGKQTVKAGPEHQKEPVQINQGKKDDHLTVHNTNPVESSVATAPEETHSVSHDLANKPVKQKNNISKNVPVTNESRSVARQLNKSIAPDITQIEHPSTPEPGNRVASNSIDASLANKNTIIVDEAVNSENHKTNNDSKEAMFASNENDETVILTNIPVDKKNSLRGLFRKASRFIDKTTALRSGQKSGILIGNIEIAFQ